MSQVYIGRGDFPSAAHCLRCAIIIAERAEESENKAQKIADISLCWSKYYVNLMAGNQPLEQARFESLQNEANSVPVCTTSPQTYEEARALYNAGVKWVQRAQAVYTLDGFVTDYITAAQDQSQMYRHLARLDTDPSNACKIHKKRVDLLQALRKDLNPQYFLAVCRQLDFETAETYVEMATLKKSTLKEGASDAAHVIQKTNILFDSAMEFYTKFLDSCRGVDGVMPETLDEHVVKPWLTARFWIARLWGDGRGCAHHCSKTQKLGMTRPEYIASLQSSLEDYNNIIAYCDKHSDLPVFKEELQLCREMIDVLPAHLHRLEAGLK